MDVKHGKLTNLNEALSEGRIDLFIGSASFEERCLSIPGHLDVSRIQTAVIGINVTYREVVQSNFNALANMFRTKLAKLALFAEDPIRSADNIAEVIGGALVGSPRRILLDITTFTRESLLMLLGFLRHNLRPHDRVEFIYAHAKDYSVGDPPEEKWLSKGIREIRSVLGFPGLMVPSRRTHMIVMVGFEDDRAVDLVRECEPSFISLGVEDRREEGTAPHHPTHEHRFRRLRSILDRVDEFTFQAYDPLATKDSLVQQASKRPDCNVVVAPMNTKISTMGAALFAFENTAVQLCYAPANIYNVARYSVPDDDYYLFELPGFPK